MFILDIILFLIVLGVNIALHEFAHFYFAKRADILCHEYAVGMGPAIYEKKKGETLYAIRAIPLGGYVSMAGEDLVDFVKVDNTVGIRLNDEGYVSHIVLDNNSAYDFIGKVKDFDLYGKDNKQLFITLNISGETIEYPVERDAMYVLSQKKEMQIAPAERSFESKTLWERFLVVFAGPVSNFLLAFFILFFVGFFVGKPTNKNVVGNSTISSLKQGDVINSVNGVTVNSFDDVVVEIYKNKETKILFNINNNIDLVLDVGVQITGLGISNISSSGKVLHDLEVGQVFGRKKDLIEGDKIISLYMGSKLDESLLVEVNNWNEIINLIDNNTNEENAFIKIDRNGEIKIIEIESINPDTLEKLNNPYIGYTVGIMEETKFNLLHSLVYPFKKVGSDMKEMAQTIGLLFNPKSGVGAKDLAGPIGIFSLVKNAKSGGVKSFMTFFAFLSINIGFLNLLPIPALDGGRLVFIGYEAITKKKVNKKVENTLITITFVLLLALMLFVTFNDALNLFR